jgi:hypothetical protein
MGGKTNKLISLLDKAIALLRRHGISHWADWLEKDKGLLEKSDYYGIEHLLSAFGGMGSFNDLYICKENGHAIKDEETSIVNDNLLAMNRAIYELAEEIQREVNAK